MEEKVIDGVNVAWHRSSPPDDWLEPFASGKQSPRLCSPATETRLSSVLGDDPLPVLVSAEAFDSARGLNVSGKLSLHEYRKNQFTGKYEYDNKPKCNRTLKRKTKAANLSASWFATPPVVYAPFPPSPVSYSPSPSLKNSNSGQHPEIKDQVSPSTSRTSPTSSPLQGDPIRTEPWPSIVLLVNPSSQSTRPGFRCGRLVSIFGEIPHCLQFVDALYAHQRPFRDRLARFLHESPSSDVSASPPTSQRRVKEPVNQGIVVDNPNLGSSPTEINTITESSGSLSSFSVEMATRSQSTEDFQPPTASEGGLKPRRVLFDDFRVAYNAIALHNSPQTSSQSLPRDHLSFSVGSQISQMNSTQLCRPLNESVLPSSPVTISTFDCSSFDESHQGETEHAYRNENPGTSYEKPSTEELDSEDTAPRACSSLVRQPNTIGRLPSYLSTRDLTDDCILPMKSIQDSTIRNSLHSCLEPVATDTILTATGTPKADVLGNQDMLKYDVQSQSQPRNTKRRVESTSDQVKKPRSDNKNIEKNLPDPISKPADIYNRNSSYGPPFYSQQPKSFPQNNGDHFLEIVSPTFSTFSQCRELIPEPIIVPKKPRRHLKTEEIQSRYLIDSDHQRSWITEPESQISHISRWIDEHSFSFKY